MIPGGCVEQKGIYLLRKCSDIQGIFFLPVPVGLHAIHGCMKIEHE
jgi:hypothetical protein